MRIGYLECFAGISGDMLLGALVDAGVPMELLRQTAESLQVEAQVAVCSVDRSGIRSTKINVQVGSEPAESAEHHRPERFPQVYEHHHEHDHGDGHSHEHHHEHAHTHGRNWGEIRELIGGPPA